MRNLDTYLLGIELRRRGWSLVVLGVVVAGVVGVVLASLAGARRAETAFDRYLAAYRSPEAAAFSEDPDERRGLADLEAVEAAVDFELVAALPAADDEGFYPLIASDGGVLGRERMRAPVVEGREPEQSEPFEVALSERTARRLHLDVGDELPLVTLTPAAQAAWENGEEVEPDGPPLTLEVVGIVRDPGDIGARESDITMTFLTGAFRDAVPGDEVGFVGEGTMVVVADGHELSDVSRLLEGRDLELDPSFAADAVRDQIGPTVQAIAVATRLFALVAAVAGVIAVGQAITRLQLATSDDDGTLGALGASRRARWRRLVLPASLAIVSGAVLGLGVAIALSVLFPIGLARRADPDVGLHVDASVLAGGVVLSGLVLVGLTAALASWRVRLPRRSPESRVSGVGRAIASLGAPPTAVTGLALASGTPGRPGRIAVAGTLLSVLGVLAALVFSASVDRLVSDHELYGWGWDASIEGADLTSLDEDSSNVLGPALADDPDVEAVATFYSQLPVTVDDQPLYAMTVGDADPALHPVIVRGAAPVTIDEVAVGRDSLEDLEAAVGDEVTISVGGEERTARITGTVALPVPQDGGSGATGVYLAPGVRELDELCRASDSCTRTIAVALRDGVDAETFADRYRDETADVDVTLPAPPGEVDRLTAVEDLPRYLAIFLAALAAAAISFATATTIRQRRRDLAVLRVLGMTGRHVRTVVAVLVLALTAAGAFLGGVLGLIVGRQVWRAVAESVALPFAPSMPVLAAFLVPAATVLLAQVVASSGRRAAARIPAAMVLRAE